MRHSVTIDLAALEYALLAEIDSQAERVRGLFITTTPSQPTIYKEKEDEALAYMADPVIDPQFIPNLVREAARESMSILDVASTILYMAHNWRQVSAVIEDLRLAAKNAVRAQSTVAGKRQAALVDWSAIEAMASQI